MSTPAQTLGTTQAEETAEAVVLPGAETAFDDSGYSIHASGAEGIELVLTAPDALSGRVTRLSPTIVWVIPHQPGALVPRGQTCQLMLRAGETVVGPLRGQLLRTEPVQPGMPVGISLVDVSMELGRQILALLHEALKRGVAEPAASALPVQEEVVDQERIRAVLSGIAAVGNKGVLRQTGRTMRIAIDRCDAEAGELYWRTDAPLAEWGAPPYEIDVIGYNSAYRLRLTDNVRPQGQHMVSPLPSQMWRIRHRWHRRVPAPPSVGVSLTHPLWPELGTVQRDLIDISMGGLCISASPDDLLFPGLLLPLIELNTGEETIGLRGEVRYVVTRGNGQTVCGLSVLPLKQEEAKWVRFVAQTLCPTTRTSENLLEPLWDLFCLSGYFNLAGRTAESFDELRNSFVNFARRSARIPQLFCQTVWPSERGIEATYSVMKTYRYTWLAHQLAKRPGKPPAVAHAPGQILRDVYMRTYEHSQADVGHRWLASYVESTTPFVERSHVRYAKRLAATGQAMSMPVRLMTAQCRDSCYTGREYTVGPATAEERGLLVEEIARTRPSCYADALDFTHDRLEMKEIIGTWQEFGLRREREIFVARRDRRPMAAMVLERGEAGTNLFCLLDSARIFPLVPLEGAQKTVYLALLDEARRWFTSRGFETFTYLREDSDSSYAEMARLEDAPEAEPHLWIISSKMVPDYLEYISELTVGRVTTKFRRSG